MLKLTQCNKRKEIYIKNSQPAQVSIYYRAKENEMCECNGGFFIILNIVISI